MGERTEILLHYKAGGEVFLYSHWIDIKSLKKILAKALDRGRERWNDESYLARIIFSDMIENEIKDLTGFGIAPYSMGEDTIVINIARQEVDGKSFEKFIDFYK